MLRSIKLLRAGIMLINRLNSDSSDVILIPNNLMENSLSDAIMAPPCMLFLAYEFGIIDLSELDGSNIVH